MTLKTHRLKFLSHLCGGEAIEPLSEISTLFLSHLCGGEDPTAASLLGIVFLSHLCGGEDGLG